jgi:hypothetical protein
MIADGLILEQIGKLWPLHFQGYPGDCEFWIFEMARMDSRRGRRVAITQARF